MVMFIVKLMSDREPDYEIIISAYFIYIFQKKLFSNNTQDKVSCFTQVYE